MDAGFVPSGGYWLTDEATLGQLDPFEVTDLEPLDVDELRRRIAGERLAAQRDRLRAVLLAIEGVRPAGPNCSGNRSPRGSAGRGSSSTSGSGVTADSGSPGCS